MRLIPRPHYGKRRRAHAYGLRAEFFCRMLLRMKGYRIVASRYLSPYGEIDIIAERFGTLAFIEVKARQDAESGLFSITHQKRRHIERSAEYWLGVYPGYSERRIRFDLMLCRPRAFPRHLCDAWRTDGG